MARFWTRLPSRDRILPGLTFAAALLALALLPACPPNSADNSSGGNNASALPEENGDSTAPTETSHALADRLRRALELVPMPVLQVSYVNWESTRQHELFKEGIRQKMIELAYRYGTDNLRWDDAQGQWREDELVPRDVIATYEISPDSGTISSIEIHELRDRSVLDKVHQHLTAAAPASPSPITHTQEGGFDIYTHAADGESRIMAMVKWPFVMWFTRSILASGPGVEERMKAELLAAPSAAAQKSRDTILKLARRAHGEAHALYAHTIPIRGMRGNAGVNWIRYEEPESLSAEYKEFPDEAACRAYVDEFDQSRTSFPEGEEPFSATISRDGDTSRADIRIDGQKLLQITRSRHGADVRALPDAVNYLVVQR